MVDKETKYFCKFQNELSELVTKYIPKLNGNNLAFILMEETKLCCCLENAYEDPDYYETLGFLNMLLNDGLNEMFYDIKKNMHENENEG